MMPRPAILLFLFVFSGCLPHSCSRSDSRALLPSDSLSRAIAAEVPEESLELIRDIPLDALLEHPRSLVYNGATGRVYVADTRTGRIASVDGGGDVAETMRDANVSVPYLAGVRGDSVAVFDPGLLQLHIMPPDGRGRTLDLDVDAPASALTYATLDDEVIYVKVVEEDAGGLLIEMDGRGAVVEKHALPGPHWRHAGMLRMWGDTLVSLAGYRPVVDVLLPNGRLDTLQLQGFDSPMLGRSRQFVQGQVSDPPLLTSSAGAAGDYLFVLNLRAGWIQVDAYDRSGRLHRVFVQPDPQPGRRFYPVDIAASEIGDGLYDFFVLLLQPSPRLLHYRTPAAGSPLTVDVP